MPADPTLKPHEVVKWRHPKVSVKLSASDGTIISSSECQLILTNQHIRIVTAPLTYRVANKGDRTFNGDIAIPLKLAKPHRFIQPWFGPYKWETMVSGKLPSDQQLEPRDALWKLLLTFLEGGSFEYRERFLHEYSQVAQAAQDGMEEPLPAYSEF